MAIYFNECSNSSDHSNEQHKSEANTDWLGYNTTASFQQKMNNILIVTCFYVANANYCEVHKE